MTERVPVAKSLMEALRESVEAARKGPKKPKATGRSSLLQGLITRVTGAVPESLKHYAGHDFDRFGIEAGVAVELAAKAVLVAINPCLIADPRHFDSLLALCGHGQVTNLQGVKTIWLPRSA